MLKIFMVFLGWTVLTKTEFKCVKLVGLGCAVRDAHLELLKVANYVTKNKGGNGAVREICDLILGIVES